MKNYHYLIIGGGMAASAAVEGIRGVDSTGSIGVIGAESDPPYNRPPLSKSLWKGEPLDSIWRKLRPLAVTVELGRTVKTIVPERKQVIDDRGEVFGYTKLLLATGGTPRRLPFADGGVIYFRTLSDYRQLRALTESGRSFAVIGGGFVGSEVAAALALNGKNVVMICSGRGIGGRLFPPELSDFVSAYYEKKGVKIVRGEKVIALEPRGEGWLLRTSAQRVIPVDGVVAGIGLQPNISLARSIDLEVADGVVVDEFLRTSRPDIFAAGDVAAFYNAVLEKRQRFEHEDNANHMGRCAGRNMTGLSEPYRHLPYFYSDLFELGYEAVGDVDAKLETFADWRRPNEEGVIYYLKDARVRGVLLWNVWGQIDAARALIAEKGPFSRENLAGRLGVPSAETKSGA